VDREGGDVRPDTARQMKILFTVAAVIGALFLLDYAVGYKQHRILEEKQAVQKRLELLAYYLERTTVDEISYTGDGNYYMMKLRYENVRPEEEMWIMVAAIKVFVQVGTLWKELSVNDLRMKRGDYSVEKLKDPYYMTVKFEMPYKNFMELMNGYMHLKVKSISNISAEAITREDILEKEEDIFLYLSTAKDKGRLKTLLR
jgi:hypothetical protein